MMFQAKGLLIAFLLFMGAIGSDSVDSSWPIVVAAGVAFTIVITHREGRNP